MPIKDKTIILRIYMFFGICLLIGVGILVQLFNIQISDGEYYRERALKSAYKEFVIEADRGNIYDTNQDLLAISVPKFNIRFDALTVEKDTFETYVQSLAQSLSRYFQKPEAYYTNLLRSARAKKNRYLLIANDLDYYDLQHIKTFPLFKKGPYRGGIIVEQNTRREYPMGKVAERTVGYDRPDAKAGLEGEFSHYLKGKNGKELRQKIARSQWKPVSAFGGVEPQDGYDVQTTIDINYQDIAHHALLEQLEKFKADHGTVILMEVETGAVKAMANLGKSKTSGKYYEQRNFAVWERYEPGSTFKLMSLVAALEDKVVDTSATYDTENGSIKFFGKTITDSRKGGYGTISIAEAFEVSSNTAFVKMIYDNYKDNPKKYVNRLLNMKLGEKLNSDISMGESAPIIPHPNDKGWSGLSLPWMAYGYGVELTPLQVLTFYNAIANNGKMMKPIFINEVNDRNRAVKNFEPQVIKSSICSQETVDKVKRLMENTVKRGTADNIYSKDLSLAGKTGTGQKYYGNKDRSLEYIASFAGYFPADKPKYSCIVVIHEPDKSIGYYGNIVAAPVFKKIAQKVMASEPQPNVFEYNPEKAIAQQFEAIYEARNEQINRLVMPQLTGMALTDAVAMVENKGLKVLAYGRGIVRKQSIAKGENINGKTQLILHAQ